MAIIHTSPLACWYELILDAQKETAVQLDTALEYYLISLLMRFTSRCDIKTTGMGIDLLEAGDDPHKLQEIGDQCLLLTGLFPLQTERRQLSLQYFIGLGQQAYMSLGHSKEQNNIFRELSNNFVVARDVLQATRAGGASGLEQDLIAALSLFQSIASPYAAQVLQRQGRINTTTH